MIAVLQRVRSGSVEVDGEVVGRVGCGYVILLGVAGDDSARESDYLARRIAELRVFGDEAGRMNRSLADVGGGALVVPQFTLLANLRKGRRPAFTAAGEPGRAEELYLSLVENLKQRGLPVATGRFGAHMLVKIENDGPATFVLDTRDLLGPGD